MIKEFLKTQRAWLTPDKKLIPCELFGHIETLKNIEEFSSFVQERLDELQGIKDDCNSLIEEDEHPEWHRYDMTSDDINREIIDHVYKQGYCTINGTTRIPDNGKAIVEVSGFKFVILNEQLPIIKSLAKQYGDELGKDVRLCLKLLSYDNGNMEVERKEYNV